LLGFSQLSRVSIRRHQEGNFVVNTKQNQVKVSVKITQFFGLLIYCVAAFFVPLADLPNSSQENFKISNLLKFHIYFGFELSIYPSLLKTFAQSQKFVLKKVPLTL
jgi:uncharacterized membrane protein YkvI